MHLAGRDQSRYNPRYCEKCERFEHPGGAVIELTMLFADVRGSATLGGTIGRTRIQPADELVLYNGYGYPCKDGCPGG